MQFLRAAFGSGGGTKDIPYNIGEAYSSAWGSWAHHQGTSKVGLNGVSLCARFDTTTSDTGDPVSIFMLTGNNAQDARLAAARNGAKRLRTVRHPNVLSFLHSSEVEKEEGGVVKPTIYIVTEPVMPLSEKIKDLKLEGTQRDEYYAWGLHQVAKAVSFLNNDCKLVHGNISLAAVVVTNNLDWKLHAFDVLSEFDGANAAAEGPMLQYEWLVGNQYKPLEVSKNDWGAVRRGPPHAIDAWGIGCLIQELFSDKKLGRTEDLRNTASIPKTLLPDYQRLLGSQPGRRLNPSKLIENSEFFQNKLVDTIQFMEVLNLKDSVEKDTFFRKLPTLAEQLPHQIVLKKLLPQLASALEFGSASAPALNPFLKLAAWLPPEDFNAKVLPTITKLFSSTDRGIRIGLLQHIESFGASLSPQVVDEQVFNHLASGFSDTSAFLRELTLKSMLILAPKLSQRTLTGSLLKHLSKLQVDEEPAIRTNTTILLGNIARHLNDATRKRVLINAFTVRALRDVFPPARAAGIMALMATCDYYDTAEMGTRILPTMVVLTVDPDPDVRSKAFQGADVFLQKLKQFYDRFQAGELSGPGAASAPSAAATSTTGLLGWAVSSLTSKSAASVPPLTSTTSAPPAALSAAAASATAALAPSPAVVETRAEPVAAAPAPLDNGWEDGDEPANGEAEQEDKDGWDDLDEEPAPSPALARIQAAQQRPVAAPSKLMTKSASQPASLSTTQHISPSPVIPTSVASQSSAEGWGAEEDEDPWAAISAPKPVSLVKPLSVAPKPKPAPAVPMKPAPGGRVGGHVQLRGGNLSLEDMLGSSMETTSGRGRGLPSGRGRGRTAAPKLGAQRLSKGSQGE